MAKKRPEEPKGGSPAWMATFSDLMNLLLCFFVLLFSMSTVDAEKFKLVIASLESSFSVLPAGGSAVDDEGQLISSGISQLEYFDVYFDASTNNTGNQEDEAERDQREQNENENPAESENTQEAGSLQDAEAVKEAYEEQALKESEEMAEAIEKMAQEQMIESQVEVDFNSQYVMITLNGALLFDSGAAQIREDAYPLVDKIGLILGNYSENIIEIEGHTDNVPIHNDEFADNNVLSAFRALDMVEYFTETAGIDPAKMKSSGRGEYKPVADNATVEGRAKNRRVEIKVYNSFGSRE
jgi:Flagellar motor protein